MEGQSRGLMGMSWPGEAREVSLAGQRLSWISGIMLDFLVWIGFTIKLKRWWAKVDIWI